ncbi:hypothetical protein CI15_07690 [Paraburkholderia monticola]|uniref:Uncharacterized protein n=1 Tax=Paraburkholderia monticola TaxID=1399968 RepID=A0A149PYG5_9BURK|nr:hypothetical protein CI15_07690 [Paraburkholderia monticola]
MRNLAGLDRTGQPQLRHEPFLFVFHRPTVLVIRFERPVVFKLRSAAPVFELADACLFWADQHEIELRAIRLDTGGYTDTGKTTRVF